MVDQKCIILFDGNCNFCRSIINWLQREDKQRKFDFLPIQSPSARILLRNYGMAFIDLQTVFLIDRDKILTRSKAMFRIFSYLEWPYKALAIFKFLPESFTDLVYKQVARNRHHLK